MYKLSVRARKDLDNIIDWTIENISVKAMRDYHQSLVQCFESIVQNPYLGTDISIYKKGNFCFNHQSHRIFYKINKNNILIVRLLHQSMNIHQHLH